MTTPKHTAEPWRTQHTVDFVRIIACVNAMIDIETP